MAILLFMLATRDRAIWQWLTLAAGVITAAVLLIYMPFTWSGGGGPVGNRYFLGTYGVFLFLVPPMQTAAAGLLTMALSALFVSPLISGPFFATRNPAEHAKTGLFRWLPTELTMVNDLPINVVPVAHPAAARRHAADPRVFHRRQRLQPRGRRVLGQRRVERRHPAARAASRPKRTRPASRCRDRCASTS